MDYQVVDVSQTDSRYPFNPRANAFELAKIEKIKRKNNPPELICVVKATGPHYLIGPAKSYSLDYPDNLENYVTQDEFTLFINEANEAILKYWPCFFTFIVAFGFAIVTCLVSLYLPKVCLEDSERFLGYVIGRYNETWEEKGVVVEFKRTLLSSQLEFYKIQNQIA